MQDPGRETLQKPVRSVCVFCGSSNGTRPQYRDAAIAMGRELAGAGMRVVYGGAQVGLMGALAQAALECGGEVVGVIPRALAAREVAHHGLTQLYVVETMHERKARMAQQSDAFVALPGGFGTLEELFEMVTWAQLGIHRKPCLLVDTEGYYRSLLEFLDRAVQQGFIQPKYRECLRVAGDAGEAMRLLSTPFPQMR